MDLQEMIKDLMAAMSESEITKIKVKQDGWEIELERNLAPQVIHTAPHHPAPHHPREVHAQTHQPAPVEKQDSPSGNYITSPMVGTYYASPGPDQSAFVGVGSRVKEDTIVCIIEAMKVMNEVKAGKSGIIKEICVENGEPVEFGSNLFRIE